MAHGVANGNGGEADNSGAKHMSDTSGGCGKQDSGNAPAGSAEVRLPRLTTTLGNAMQCASALVFASYFFFAPVMGLALASTAPLLGWGGVAAVAAAYFAQLFLYKPHLHRGWPAWVLDSSLSDYVGHYYDATCIREGPELDPSRRYVFAMYPHGVYGVCRLFTGGMKLWRTLFPGISVRWGSFGMAFYLPGIREFSLLCGCLDASKPVLSKAIARGENIALLPGGLDEMALTDGTSSETTLVGRKGFVALAIENGMDIVPGFCFGEKWVHRTMQLPGPVRKFMRRFQMSGTMLKGRGATFLGFLGVPLGFVWAEPIRVRQQRPPEPAYVDEVHAAVEASLHDAFNRHKVRFGYGEEETLTMVTVDAAKAAARASDSPSKKAD